jgi:hypothetical protein
LQDESHIAIGHLVDFFFRRLHRLGPQVEGGHQAGVDEEDQQQGVEQRIVDAVGQPGEISHRPGAVVEAETHVAEAYGGDGVVGQGKIAAGPAAFDEIGHLDDLAPAAYFPAGLGANRNDRITSHQPGDVEKAVRQQIGRGEEIDLLPLAHHHLPGPGG